MSRCDRRRILILAAIVFIAGPARSELRPTILVAGRPMYVMNAYPRIRDLVEPGPVPSAAPIYLVRSGYPTAEELARFQHLRAGRATLVVVARRYPTPAEGAIFIHAPARLEIVLATDRLPDEDDILALFHAGRDLSVLIPGVDPESTERLFRRAPRVHAFRGPLRVRRAILEESGLPLRARRPRRCRREDLPRVP